MSSKSARGRILAHRGWWDTASKQNTLLALRKALEHDFGVETDFRDLNGEIVLSHDPPVGPSCDFLKLEEFLDIYQEYEPTSWLALNIKSDGIAEKFAKCLKARRISNYFVFDMSVPDTVAQLRAGLRVFTRFSDLESSPPLLSAAEGVWLDHFSDGHVSAKRARDFLRLKKKAAFVSPELHGRDPKMAWADWRQSFDWAQDDRIMICTDLPDRVAEEFLERGGD